MDEVNKLGKILIVDDNEDVLFALNLLLEPYTEKIKVATTPDRIEHFMTTFQPDLILLDMNFSRDAISGQEGFESLKQILQIDPQAIVIFMTAYADTDKAVRAIKAGATDFIPKPWEKEKLLATLTSGMRLRQSQREVNILKEQVEALSGQSSPEGDIIGESPIMQEVFATINKLSSTDANILILGENGTGKDVIARLLYRYSPRYGKPFVTIDLGSIPEQLFESELFGFEKGAFTDAKKSKAGRMEVATNGTLFLDEIGNLSLPMQSKLLTAIEKRQISRLGSTQTMPIDVRLICATNADIRHMVDEGSFRQDLLYRINTIEIHIPPLRERGNDIILLAEYFLDRYARKYKKEMRGLTREAKNKLLKYTWPGNVRPKPWEKEKLLATLTSGMRLRQSQREVNILKEQVEALSGQSSPEGDIIGESPIMQEVFATINKLSSTDANILILGENGTGKDVIARLLYRYSPRYGKPFVTIDLGSIPEQLFESELFGFEKGAFTDAKKSKAGRMEVATNGTLFLDEIGNLSLPMQSKLLTAIEKRQISRLGSTQTMPIDVRLICATNADIRHMVDEGSFRQDLLYRINTIEIHIPPLRERGNDIILLAEYFLDRYARKYKKEMRGLTREAKNKLLKYTWPGNVRELQHTMERVVILGDGSLLKPENFQFHVTPKQKKEEEIVLNLEQLERQTIEKAMKLSEGNISRAADYLGITRFALYRKLEKLGL